LDRSPALRNEQPRGRWLVWLPTIRGPSSPKDTNKLRCLKYRTCVSPTSERRACRFLSYGKAARQLPFATSPEVRRKVAHKLSGMRAGRFDGGLVLPVNDPAGTTGQDQPGEF
jgi:hypothetical protein